MDNKEEICKLFSVYGFLTVEITSRNDTVARVLIGDKSFEMKINPIYGFFIETRHLSESLADNFGKRIQSQFKEPGKINLKMLSD